MRRLLMIASRKNSVLGSRLAGSIKTALRYMEIVMAMQKLGPLLLC